MGALMSIALASVPINLCGVGLFIGNFCLCYGIMVINLFVKTKNVPINPLLKGGL